MRNYVIYHCQFLTHGLVFPLINYETSSSTQDNLIKLFYKTKRYGKYSRTVITVELWKKIQKRLKDMPLRDLSPNKIKTINIINKTINKSINKTINKSY